MYIACFSLLKLQWLPRSLLHDYKIAVFVYQSSALPRAFLKDEVTLCKMGWNAFCKKKKLFLRGSRHGKGVHCSASELLLKGLWQSLGDQFHMWALNLMCFEAPIADKYIMCVIFSKNLEVANFTVVIFEVKNTVNLF